MSDGEEKILLIRIYGWEGEKMLGGKQMAGEEKR
jgi:hypothetical protein